MPVNDVAGVAVALRGDLEQAEYFHTLLGRQRAEMCQRLADQHAALVKHEHAGDLSGIRRKQRIIKALTTEIHAIDRMLQALALQLDLPVRRLSG